MKFGFLFITGWIFINTYSSHLSLSEEASNPARYSRAIYDILGLVEGITPPESTSQPQAASLAGPSNVDERIEQIIVNLRNLSLSVNDYGTLKLIIKDSKRKFQGLPTTQEQQQEFNQVIKSSTDKLNKLQKQELIENFVELTKYIEDADLLGMISDETRQEFKNLNIAELEQTLNKALAESLIKKLENLIKRDFDSYNQLNKEIDNTLKLFGGNRFVVLDEDQRKNINLILNLLHKRLKKLKKLDSFRIKQSIENYHGILNLNPEPEPAKEDIIKSFKKLSLKYHPDRVTDERLKYIYTKIFQIINEAKDTLLA